MIDDNELALREISALWASENKSFPMQMSITKLDAIELAEIIRNARRYLVLREITGTLTAEVRRLREENERLRKDAERLDWIANEYTHIEPFGIPTGEGDSETGWKVSQEQCGQIKPKRLSVVYKDSLREAIDAARGAK